MIIKSHKLFPEQAKIAKSIIESPKKVSTICTSRQFGKSNLVSTLALYWAINQPKSKIAFFTPYYSLGLKVLEEIAGWLDEINIVTTNKSTKEIRFKNKSSIRFFSTDNKQAIRGFTFDYIIVDEASFIPDGVYADIIGPTFMVKGKKMIICSTPLTKSSWFYGQCTNPDNDYYWANYLSNPFVDRDWIESQRRSMPIWKFRCEYLGEWLDSELSVFSHTSEICSLEPRESHKEKTYGGLDIGLKNDYTVLTILNNKAEVVNMIRFTGVNPELLVTKVVEAIKTYNIGTMVVEENFESTIIELIRKGSPSTYIEGFRTSNKTKLDIIERLIVAFDYKQIKHLKLREVQDEFSSFIKVDLPTGYTYRAEKGKHDDIVMSTALAYYCFKEYYRTTPVKFINL